MDVDKWIEERARTRYGRLDCGEAVHFMSALRSMRPLIEAAMAVDETRVALKAMRARIAVHGERTSMLMAEDELEHTLEAKLRALADALRELGVPSE